ncbi:MAG: hypothetical protein JWQ04_1995 [Pedosphaera sp.]|nr:hypothetical protein [Pedosphaera sp.]
MKHRAQFLTISLGVLSVLLLILSASIFWNYASLKIRLKFADEQTLIFEKMRRQAVSADPPGAVDCLSYIANYYPSGSKQVTGSILDSLVERERNHAISDIIASLRVKTRQDLGDSPAPWIQKYGKGK